VGWKGRLSGRPRTLGGAGAEGDAVVVIVVLCASVPRNIDLYGDLCARRRVAGLARCGPADAVQAFEGAAFQGRGANSISDHDSASVRAKGRAERVLRW
jgi:hypothetical protein